MKTPTSETVKHTRGPYSVFGCAVYQNDCWNAGHNEGGKRICSTYSGSPEEERDEMPTEEQSANAAFIVTACNAHEMLLDACRAARIWLLEAYGDQKPHENSPFEQIERAISQATNT